MNYQTVEHRREDFLVAAIRVIAREGVARATTRLIAAEANATLALLHYCYKTKEELLTAVFERCTEEGLKRAAIGIDDGMGLLPVLERIVANFSSWTVEDRGSAVSQFELVLWSRRQLGSKGIARRAYQRYTAGTAQLLIRGSGGVLNTAEAQRAAEHLIALIDGHTLQWDAVGNPGFSARANAIPGMVASTLAPDN